MKTNVKITLTNDQRRHLANLVDNKQNLRLITRAELNELCLVYIDGLIASAEHREAISPGGRHYVTRGLTKASPCYED